MLRIGSLFSGIGGLDLGLEAAGLGRVVWQVEKDPQCIEWLARQWPDAPQFYDVCGLTGLPPVDVLCGGFPCQDVSGAGKGAGLAGSRSGLWFEYARIAAELRPEWVIVENVASGARRWVDPVCAGLGELGYATLSIPLSAEDVGASHRRQRIFVLGRLVANADGEPVRYEQQWVPARRTCGVQDERKAFAARARASVAYGRSFGLCFERARDVRRHRERGALTDRRGALVACPPSPGDVDGWRRWIANGGAQPGILPGSDGLPRKVARAMIAAYGNAVYPPCAETIAHYILEILEREGRTC